MVNDTVPWFLPGCAVPWNVMYRYGECLDACAALVATGAWELGSLEDVDDNSVGCRINQLHQAETVPAVKC